MDLLQTVILVLVVVPVCMSITVFGFLAILVSFDKGTGINPDSY